ncbi:hypothetical protein Mgra_00004328 [Meloidogyne graminicola]|uniref:Uncharacterized protein n=1 Tax=Meloidogyne graminicola TaxID=189291 RepID=A0A8S9ZSJ1_9BILA|nr:hypothetical protein Mgra_00004328 [Meloidogyne graminicola]
MNSFVINLNCFEIILITLLIPISSIKLEIFFYIFFRNSLFLCISFGNLVCHLIIIERAIATFYINKYEKIRIPYFGILSICLLLFLTTIDRLISSKENVSFNLLSIITIHLTLALSIIEIILFIKLHSFNKGNYNQFKKYNSNKPYKLNSRYQQLENVYTGNQLAPSFIFHFLNILGSNLLKMNLI